MKTILYIHSEKETLYEIGEELGLTGEALQNFSYALYEVDFEVDVDEKTGDITILKVNGKNLER
jgi:hypothetical protein